MRRLLRPVLILLLVLLPLRGWAQASMTAGDCGMQGEVAAMQHTVAAPSPRTDAMAAMDMAADPAMHACHTQAVADHATHDHQHCVICHLAVAQPPAFALLTAQAVQHPCPTAADTAWRSAELPALQRPPRA